MFPRFPSMSRALPRMLLAGLLAAVPAAYAPAASPALQLVDAGAAETLELSLDELAAMPQTTVATETEFTDGMVTFSGPLVRDVLAKLGLDKRRDGALRRRQRLLRRHPDRAISREYPAILAMDADGKRLSRRDKGPLWLMYPISDHAALGIRSTCAA